MSKRPLTKEDDDVSLPSVSPAVKRTKLTSELESNKVKIEQYEKIKRIIEQEKQAIETEEKEPDEVTEAFLLNWCSVKYLFNITSLDLNGCGLKCIDPIILNLNNLEELILYNNNIPTMNLCKDMKSLVKLDITNNFFTNIMFTVYLPNLELIEMKHNKFKTNALISLRFFVCTFCPKMQQISDMNVSSYHCAIKLKKSNLTPQIKAIFSVQFDEQTDVKQLEENREEYIDNLVTTMREQCSSNDMYMMFLIDLESTKVVTDAIQALHDGVSRDVLLSNTREKRHVTPTVAALNAIKDNKEAKHSRKGGKQSKKDTATPTKLSSSVAKVNEYNNVECEEIDSLPVADYQPVKFIRCHYNCKTSKVDSTQPLDDVTKVWQIAFEPDPEYPSKQLDTVATCGGSTVCIIDCPSGKVIKRFKDVKEQFYCLAWTTLKIDNDDGKRWNSNILAVGGLNGHIKLFIPHELICYAEIGSGRPNLAVECYYASSLMFHEVNSSWLFVSYSDATICLFDIGSPLGKYQSTMKYLMIFMSYPGNSILNMVHSDPYDALLGGTDTGLFLWTTKKTYNRKDQLRKVGIFERSKCELIFEEIDYTIVDGICKVKDNMIATKFVSCDYIVIWSVPEVVKKLAKMKNNSIKVNILLILKWHMTSIDFIMPSCSNGYLVCGNDKGLIFVYKIPDLKHRACKRKMNVSRIIQWPLIKKTNLITENISHDKDSVINYAVISKDNKYIISGTDTNLACIWKRRRC